MNFKFNLLILFFTFLFSTFPVLAQEMATDRPDQTESSSSVEKGVLQIESGIVLEINENTSKREDNLLFPTTLFRIGIHDLFELRLLTQIERNAIANEVFSGFSDLEIGTKIQLFQRENSSFEMAFLSHLRVPTGTKNIRKTNFASINKLCLNHTFSDQFSLGYNIGYNYENRNDTELSYSLALNVRLSDKVGIYVEPYGIVANYEELVANFDSGFTYLFADNLQFDFSFGLGLNNYMNYWSVGMSWKSKR
jgi:hypothetical protein